MGRETELSNSYYECFRPARIKNAAQFVDKEVYFPQGDSHQGKATCRNYQIEPLKACSLGSRMHANGAPISEIVWLKSAQVGYTFSLLSSICYHVVHKPTKMALYFPSDTAAKQFAKNELTNFFAAQPCLEGLVDSKSTVDGKSRYDSKHFPGGSFRMLAANKSADLASSTYRLIYLDELDLFPTKVGKEGDPLRLIKDRAKEYSDALLVYGGTPRGDFNTSITWNLYHQSDMRRFYVPCPKCGKMQYLAYRQFEIGKSDYNFSGFRCVDDSCNHLILDSDKDRMIDNGEWRATNNGTKEGSIVVPGRAGFAIWAAYSQTPTAAWPNLARQRDQAGYNSEKLRAFMNTTVGLPTTSGDLTGVKPENILDNPNIKASKYETIDGAEGIPNDVVLITVGVDIQSSKTKGRLEYGLYGWSKKHCWFLNHAKIPGDFREQSVWDALDAVTSTKFLTEDRKRLIPVSRAFIDCSDGIANSTVLTRCRKHERWAPIKGFSISGKPLVSYQKTQHTKQWMFQCNTVVAKDKIRDLLKEWCGGDPDSELKLPYDLDAEVAQGYCSEYRTTNQGSPPRVIWVHNGSFPNECLDCFVYALAAKESLIGHTSPEVFWRRREKKVLINKKPTKANLGINYPDPNDIR